MRAKKASGRKPRELDAAPEELAALRRWPAVLAIIIGISLYALLPSAIIALPRFVIPTLGALLIVPLIVEHSRRQVRGDRYARMLTILLIALMGLANTVALVMLLDALINGNRQGANLLVGAAQVWTINVLVFSLVYWEIDRGGPLRRGYRDRTRLPPADLRFPQDEDHDAVDEVAKRSAKQSDWRPAYLDYLYVSCTNSTAFSPTDTMPLTYRMKGLMAIQGVEALVLSVLVIARGVNVLH